MAHAVEAGIAAEGDPFDVSILSRPEIRGIYGSIIRTQVSMKTGFKDYELIGPFGLVPGPFTVGDELSAKQEVKRHVISKKFAAEVAALFQ